MTPRPHLLHDPLAVHPGKDRSLRDGLLVLAGGVIGVVLARNFFESEKKVTHDFILDYGVDDPPFRRTINHFLGPPLVEGNDVHILENGCEIFPAMLEAIGKAEKSVTLENFVFCSGSIAMAFARALADRARAGVRVHFLQDAVGCNCIYGDEMKVMKDAGVHVEIFRYFHLRFNERTHRKLLVVDGKVGFIGGVGISDAWDGDAESTKVWRDIQYKVEGPVVAQMQQAFLDNWVQTRGDVLHGDDYFPEVRQSGPFTCQAFQSSSSEGADSARLLFLFSIAAARRSVRIANAYFIPDDLLVSTIVQARERGVDVEVITAGPAIDQRTVRLVGRSRWRPMLEAGVRIHEYMTALYHCKYMIVDDVWTCVGSCNFDSRSLRLNEEANLNVHNRQFAAMHAEIFEKDKAESRQISLDEWRHRPWHDKIVGNLGCLVRSQL